MFPSPLAGEGEGGGFSIRCRSVWRYALPEIVGAGFIPPVFLKHPGCRHRGEHREVRGWVAMPTNQNLGSTS